MTTITTYRIEDDSEEALWAALCAASNGKAEPYAFAGEAGERAFDEARVRLPWLDDAGRWASEVALVDSADASLAAMAAKITIDDGQAARG